MDDPTSVPDDHEQTDDHDDGRTEQDWDEHVEEITGSLAELHDEGRLVAVAGIAVAVPEGADPGNQDAWGGFAFRGADHSRRFNMAEAIGLIDSINGGLADVSVDVSVVEATGGEPDDPLAGLLGGGGGANVQAVSMSDLLAGSPGDDDQQLDAEDDPTYE